MASRAASVLLSLTLIALVMYAAHSNPVSRKSRPDNKRSALRSGLTSGKSSSAVTSEARSAKGKLGQDTLKSGKALKTKFSYCALKRGSTRRLRITYRLYRNGVVVKKEIEYFPLKANTKTEKLRILKAYKKKIRSRTSARKISTPIKSRVVTKENKNRPKKIKKTNVKNQNIQIQKDKNDDDKDDEINQEDNTVVDVLEAAEAVDDRQELIDDEDLEQDEKDAKHENSGTPVGDSGVESVCFGPEAAVTDASGNLVIFQHGRYFKFDQLNNEVESGAIESEYEGIPWSPLAAHEFPGKTVFYNGDEMVSYVNGQMESPSPSSSPSSPSSVDAEGTHDNKLYVMTGCQMAVSLGKTKMASVQAPEVKLPCDVDAAWSDRESGSGSLTVVKGGQYWVWPSYHWTAVGPFPVEKTFHFRSLRVC